MPDYQALYLHLFNAVTDALRVMDENDCPCAYALLIRGQQECEEIYIASEDE